MATSLARSVPRMLAGGTSSISSSRLWRSPGVAIDCPLLNSRTLGAPNSIAGGLAGGPLVGVRSLVRWKAPPTYEPIEIPVAQRRLPILERVPKYKMGVRPPKVPKELGNIRGPETVNNRLLYNQYGVMTLCGGWIRPGHIDMMRNTINRGADFSKMFAVWRIDPPFKPITKKGQGKRMGSGKGAIDHYVVPVKAGRILFEVGGIIDFKEIEPLLQEVCYKLPVDAIPVCQEVLDSIEARHEAQMAANINPFNLRRIIDYNMYGSDRWIGKYDKVHQGDYI